MDHVSPRQRSALMSRIRSRDTVPERLVRSHLHRMGYRFRLHRSDLPGRPDVVLPRFRRVIFVHGCFWHGHEGCGRSKRPSTNVDFWNKKLDATIDRDKKNRRLLTKLGWTNSVIWECETKDPKTLSRRLYQIADEMKCRG